ncbi:S8 family serine peptidase [Kitasatospora acidiphila]|uniref:S8 family serine peptidase n=1 Tax=Kitasatospora acidiphila TaxID=2567942 RepID=UPI003C789618
MRRTVARTRGLGTTALLALSLSLGGVFAPAAQALDNPRQGEWYLDALHLPQTWQTANGSGVTVALIDSGVKADHPDLVGQVLPGKDFSGLQGGVGTDATGGGTQVASIIAGSGKGFSGKGVMGLAPGAKILPIKVNYSRGSETIIPEFEYLKQVDQAITYAVDQGAKVIDVSFGVEADTLTLAQANDLQNAVNYALNHGRLVVTGAGDNGQTSNGIMYPADAVGVAAITAIDHNGASTQESEHGKYVALSAPGVDVVGACTGTTGYCTNHGTATSAAMVSAMGAILFSQHPDWTGNQVLRVLMDTANKPNDGSVHNDGVGFGSASISKAVKYTGDPGPAADSPVASISVTLPPSTFVADPNATPSPAAPSPTPTPSPSADRSLAPITPRKPLASSSSNSDALAVLIAGAVADALFIAVLVGLLIRRNRRNRPATPPSPYPASPAGPYRQPQG